MNAPLNNETTQTEFTEELRFQNTDHNDRLNWLGGIFYENSVQHDFESASDNHFAQVLSEFGTTPIDYFGFNPLGNVTYEANEKTYQYQLAGFANVSYRIFDGLTASAGVRVARDRLSYFLFGQRAGQWRPRDNHRATEGHAGDTTLQPVLAGRPARPALRNRRQGLTVSAASMRRCRSISAPPISPILA